MLERIADDLWVEARPLRFLGLETGTRMTVVCLAGGGLFVHSPVAIERGTKEAVDALGRVLAIVAPSRFHHLYVGEWSRAYPDAILCACPGLDRKRPDVPWRRILGDTPEPEWRGEIDQVLFSARWLENEVVFFHRASRSLVCADAVFHFGSHQSRLTRTAGRLIGGADPGATWLARLTLRDRGAARAQVDRMLAWQPERIVLAHGAIIERDASEVLRRAYAWL